MKTQNPNPFGRPSRRAILRTALALPLASFGGACCVGGTFGGGSVIVIGAGVAGLAAANRLREHGLDVVVIEGRDRVGGRVVTDRSLGTAIDLGASYIEGDSRDNPIAKLVAEAGIVTSSDLDNVALYDVDGSEVDVGEIESNFQTLLAEIESLGEGLSRDITLRDAFDRVLVGETLSAFERRALEWAINSVVTMDAAAEPEDLSLFGLAEDEEFSGEDVLFPDGYDQVPTTLARGLDIRLGHRVVEIAWDSTGVTVETEQETFRADGVVVTVPLGVLKSEQIRFSPGLPQSKRQAISRLQMGVLNKVAVRFPRTFWPSDTGYVGTLSETTGEFPAISNWHAVSGEPVLLAWTGGAFARSLEPLSDDAVVDRLMAVLRRIAGTAIPDPVQMVRSSWAADPWTHGSYSYVPLGATYDDYRAMAEPVDNRVFFAGEATNPQYPATVHGAYLSGIREADRIAWL